MEAERRAPGDLKQEVLAVLAAAPAPLTPGEVRDALGTGLAYTTVMTVLSRLRDQGLVARQRAGRAYAYTAVIDRAEVTARQMRRLLDGGGGDRVAVLRRFLGVLSDDDERALIDLIGRIDRDEASTGPDGTPADRDGAATHRGGTA